MNAAVPSWQGPEQTVDVVLVVQVLYWVLDPVYTLKQMYSWLKPGGSLIILHDCENFIFSNIGIIGLCIKTSHLKKKGTKMPGTYRILKNFYNERNFAQ